MNKIADLIQTLVRRHDDYVSSMNKELFEPIIEILGLPTPCNAQQIAASIRQNVADERVARAQLNQAMILIEQIKKRLGGGDSSEILQALEMALPREPKAKAKKA